MEKTKQDCFDLILAAGREKARFFSIILILHITDVVYDPSVITNLVKTIQILLETNRECSAYIANAIRNDSTYAQFQQTLSTYIILSTDDLFIL